MENVQQIINEEHREHDRREGIREKFSDGYDSMKDTAQDLKETFIGKPSETPEEEFRHKVGHFADEMAECLDDQCTTDVFGAAEEPFHHLSHK
ncbi:unnamed protein product [Bursaphelenchus xylophilus]|uniref:(pine wood nematode) hypothetical protein n=1 Tax=Bursaphelenchus xylophilus TaxID=6326 RepID=A0A1I7RX74_BURXY|nr:unnamed protein product [Bursaphelenchus xylophilus]CAG9121388.1 unnamed protein product [Bursaphelenchus xylophilus]